ncbi:MAG: septum formation family protein [Frankia sp.]
MAITTAVASLFTPILPGVVTFVAAHHASRRIRASGERLGGRDLLVWARLIASLGLLIWTLFLAAIVVGASTDRTTRTGIEAADPATGPAAGRAGRTPTGPPAPITKDVDDLAVGDCLRDPVPDGVETVTVVPCASAHAEEVFGRTSLAGTRFVDVNRNAARACSTLFGPYVGVPYADSNLDGSDIQPSHDSWASGDRGVVCLLGNADGSALSRSMRGSGPSGAVGSGPGSAPPGGSGSTGTEPNNTDPTVRSVVYRGANEPRQPTSSA